MRQPKTYFTTLLVMSFMVSMINKCGAVDMMMMILKQWQVQAVNNLLNQNPESHDYVSISLARQLVR
jgi:hypothetical protein